MPQIHICDKCNDVIRNELMIWRIEGWKTETFYYCYRCHAELLEQLNRWVARPPKTGKIVRMNTTGKHGGNDE